VKSIEVVSPSGLDFLDRVAVKSVKDASPFYNVPRGLLDAKGELSFEFGFLVGGSRATPVRPRWQPQ
jgi:outer membrane biosynthesis protein TonB